jgi:hypothetical protein
MTQIERSVPTLGVGRLVAAFLLLFGATALTVRCVAVGTQAPHGSAAGHVSHAGPPLTLEQLATKAGCQPRIQGGAADKRQGYCTTQDGKFVLITFTSDKGQNAWLDQAQEYGKYLVGNRWAAGSSPQVLEKLRAKLGGDIAGASHGGA